MIKRFAEYTTEGKEFINRYNKISRYGEKKEIANHFKISIASFDRVRNNLKLPLIFQTKGKKINKSRERLEKRIIKYYHNKNRSTPQIAKIMNMSSDSINKILKNNNIELRNQNEKNPLYFKNKNADNPYKIIREIKRLHEENKTIKDIAKTLNIDQSSVSKKLKAMGYQTRRRGYFKGGYPCNWCNQIMKEVHLNTGDRKQLYCSSKCKSKAKDYRAYIRGRKTFVNALSMMENFLKETWKDKYKSQKQLILNAKPIIREINKSSPLMRGDDFESGKLNENIPKRYLYKRIKRHIFGDARISDMG